MVNEVCSSLGLVGKDLSGRLLQIVEVHGSDASFMLGSLMWNASDCGAAVCLLALHNSSSHYQNVTKRLGFNLKAAIENKTATVLEPFSMYVNAELNYDELNMGDETKLKKLFFDLKETLKSMSNKKYLIIDDLSELMCLGGSVADVVALLQYCRALQEVDKDLALIVCSHLSEENDDERLLSNFLAHVADYRVTVAGLKTGFSANVTGSMQVVDKLETKRTNNVVRYLLHFKLTDRQVKLFAPGSVGISV